MRFWKTSELSALLENSFDLVAHVGCDWDMPQSEDFDNEDAYKNAVAEYKERIESEYDMVSFNVE